jgi:predicted transcriptional regulator
MFILAIVALAGYGLYEFYNYFQARTTAKEMAGPGKDNEMLNHIMHVVFYEANLGTNKALPRNNVSKVVIMENLNIKPKDLKRYIGILQSKNLVTESTDVVNITAFGVQFFKVFQNDKLNISSS